jgi:hypothetical protein
VEELSSSNFSFSNPERCAIYDYLAQLAIVNVWRDKVTASADIDKKFSRVMQKYGLPETFDPCSVNDSSPAAHIVFYNIYAERFQIEVDRYDEEKRVEAECELNTYLESGELNKLVRAQEWACMFSKTVYGFKEEFLHKYQKKRVSKKFSEELKLEVLDGKLTQLRWQVAAYPDLQERLEAALSSQPLSQHYQAQFKDLMKLNHSYWKACFNQDHVQAGKLLSQLKAGLGDMAPKFEVELVNVRGRAANKIIAKNSLASLAMRYKKYKTNLQASVKAQAKAETLSWELKENAGCAPKVRSPSSFSGSAFAQNNASLSATVRFDDFAKAAGGPVSF